MPSICSCGRPIVAWTKFRRKVISPSPDHDLCQRCWKGEQDSSRLTKDQHDQAVFISRLNAIAQRRPEVIEVPQPYARAVAEHIRANDTALSVDFWTFQLERGHMSIMGVPLRIMG